MRFLKIRSTRWIGGLSTGLCDGARGKRGAVKGVEPLGFKDGSELRQCSKTVFRSDLLNVLGLFRSFISLAEGCCDIGVLYERYQPMR
jgi:hypothetical protein